MRSPYEHFLDRAMRLEESRFWAWMRTPRGQPDWERVLAGEWLAHEGLDVDQFEAFCLNLRLLIQDRDGISIRSMRKLSEMWPPEYALQRLAIETATTILSERLAAQSLVQLWDNGTTTNQSLFEIVFYGGVAHSDTALREEFESIIKSGLFSAFAFQSFCSVLLHYRNCIVAVAKAVAEHLDGEAKRSAA